MNGRSLISLDYSPAPRWLRACKAGRNIRLSLQFEGVPCVSGFVPEASACILESRTRSAIPSRKLLQSGRGHLCRSDRQPDRTRPKAVPEDREAGSERSQRERPGRACDRGGPCRNVAEPSNPLAPEARTDGDTEAEAKVNVEQDVCEAIQPVEATAPAADIPTDPATVETPAIIDPNAVAPAVVAAPVVAAPVVAAADNAAETPSEATDEPLAGADAAAPALPSADENRRTDDEEPKASARRRSRHQPRRRRIPRMRQMMLCLK